MTCEIVELSIEDYDDLIAFWRDQDGIGLNDSDTREQIAGYLKRNAGMSFLVRDGGRVVAAVLAGHDGRRGYLHHLAVAPSHRRRGLARALVERCVEALVKEGIQKCNIFLFADNAEGRGFWRAIGYKERGDLLLMQRVIGGRLTTH